VVHCNRLQTIERHTEPDAPERAIAEDFLSGRRAVAALCALGACSACFVTTESLPIGLLPQIAGATHESLSVTGLLVTIYALVVVVTTVPLSHATRRLPRSVLLASVAGVLILGCLGSAIAHSFAELLAARVVTALAQAIFWAVGPVEATNMVRPELRGRAVSAVFGGSAVGLVMGLPAATWLGHLTSWRFAFVALAAAALLLLMTIVVAIPRRSPVIAQGDDAHAVDHRLYRVTVLTTGLGVAAFYCAYTYVTPFLERLSGVPHGSITLVLLGAGLASTLGLSAGGTLYARYRGLAAAVAIAIMVVSLFCLFAFARLTIVAPLFVALTSMGLGLLCVASQTAVIEFGPHHGTAWFSTGFNVGIASGPLIGGLTLGAAGLRETALVGALIGAGALALALAARSRTARAAVGHARV
jgi:MFS transporter, DHA1 family, inner membrane transport protein